MGPTIPLVHERVVISEAELWRPLESRSSALDAENRRGLDSRRAIAYLLDRLVLLIPSAVAVGLFGENGGVLVATALTLAYFFLWEALNGQTAGKQVMGLRVVRRDGAPLNLAAVATRNVLLLVDQFVGIFFIVATRRRQRLGDLVAGTVVTAAGEHAHVAATERFRPFILAGYPIAWIGAAVVAGVLAVGQAEGDRYLRLANTTCERMSAVISAHPETGVAEYHRMIADVEVSLRALPVPADKRAGHDRLVTLLHRERALLGRATRAHGAERARIARRFQALVERQAPAMRADGYPACA